MIGFQLKKMPRCLVKNFIISSLLLLITSCDPIYNCYINNTCEREVYVKISPPIQSIYYNSEWVVDTLNKQTVEITDSFAIYKIAQKEEMFIYNAIEVHITEKTFNINYIEIYSLDTLILDTKEKMISAFTPGEKKGQYKLIIKDYNKQ